MTTPTTAERIRTTGDAVTRLVHALAHAAEVQYDRPAGPSTRGESPERAKGGVSRPTEDIAMDERRLKLRAAVIEAELELEGMEATALEQATRLEDALTEWAGVRA
ncbi:hypothetical protein SEA_BARNSTORMER_48 [Microbacterium phage Barnstormer]|uniref:Uncharacterized protein n=1 Tax=Microbacterium phage Barnstormer TaxID=3028491 RepID=A0AAE9ZKW3_9CAUD|nr:hypothetical protein SEA_BARNSTORMER_48 [Microbacterium phage Barnstormer]WDS52154.1 hypothetical protein SEA_UTZCHIPS_48 [Microbacterium phage UtzChips]